MKRYILLLLLGISAVAHAGGDEKPLPPPLPPIGPFPPPPTTTTTTTVTAPAAAVAVPPAPATKDDTATCIGAKIICECKGGSAPAAVKPKTITKTVIKTVEKPVEKIVYRDKIVYQDRIVYRDAVPTEKVCPACTAQATATVTPDTTSKDKEFKGGHVFSLLVGGGPNGMDMKLYGNTYEFKKDFGTTAGLQYQYFFENGLGLGLGGFLNETTFGSLNYFTH